MLFAVLALTDFYVCPVKFFLRIPCPGCGLTRGFTSILHFHIFEAFNYNALSIPLFLIMGGIAFFGLSDLIFKTKVLSSLSEYRFTTFQIVNLVMIFALNWSMNIIRGI